MNLILLKVKKNVFEILGAILSFYALSTVIIILIELIFNFDWKDFVSSMNKNYLYLRLISLPITLALINVVIGKCVFYDKKISGRNIFNLEKFSIYANNSLISIKNVFVSFVSMFLILIVSGLLSYSFELIVSISPIFYLVFLIFFSLWTRDK